MFTSFLDFVKRKVFEDQEESVFQKYKEMLNKKGYKSYIPFAWNYSSFSYEYDYSTNDFILAIDKTTSELGLFIYQESKGGAFGTQFNETKLTFIEANLGTFGNPKIPAIKKAVRPYLKSGRYAHADRKHEKWRVMVGDKSISKDYKLEDVFNDEQLKSYLNLTIGVEKL